MSNFKELNNTKLIPLNTEECEKVNGGGASSFLWHVYCCFLR